MNDGMMNLKRNLEAQKAQDQGGPVNWGKIQEEWKEEVEKLFTKIRGWLQELTDADLIEISTEEVPISEDHLGQYNIPSLMLRTPSEKVIRIVPVGRLIIGAKGRVDIRSGSKVSMLLHTDEGWFLGIKTPELTLRKLDKDLLGDILTMMAL